MVACNKLNWYAAYTRVNQELLIKRKLDELGIENFLPQEEQVRETPLGRKKDPCTFDSWFDIYSHGQGHEVFPNK